MVTKTEIDQRVKERMDLVESMIKEQKHISDPDAFYEALSAANKYWSAMDEGDREYYEYAAWAFEQKRPWVA